jgi:hypothetical protein
MNMGVGFVYHAIYFGELDFSVVWICEFDSICIWPTFVCFHRVGFVRSFVRSFVINICVLTWKIYYANVGFVICFAYSSSTLTMSMNCILFGFRFDCIIIALNNRYILFLYSICFHIVGFVVNLVNIMMRLRISEKKVTNESLSITFSCLLASPTLGKMK